MSNWVAGSYRLSFSAAQRGNYQAARQDLRVLVDGVAVGTFNPSGSSYQSYTTDPFTVTAGSHTITFVGLNTAGGDNTAFVDGISVGLAPDTLSNVGFEAPAVGSGYQYNPAGAGWTFAGGAGVAGNNSAFTSGNPAAPEGTQVAFLQGSGSISQVVAGWVPSVYRVRFRAAQRGNYQAARQDFLVLVDGVSIGTFTPSGTGYLVYATDAFSISDSGSHTIAFVGLNTAGGDNTALLDDIQIVPA